VCINFKCQYNITNDNRFKILSKYCVYNDDLDEELQQFNVHAQFKIQINGTDKSLLSKSIVTISLVNFSGNFATNEPYWR